LKFSKLSLKVVSSLVLTSTLLIPIGEAKASTISVKLVNYLGDVSSVGFDTNGTYKLANNNTRIAGADRFEVASNVAKKGWNTADAVIVVNYLAFADALSAAPLATKYDAPILLTAPSDLNDQTAKKIKELGASKVYIIGGTGSVSTKVETQLKDLVGSVQRIPGKDRYDVAENVASQMGSSSSAIIANGLVFSDALAIAPYAAKAGIPILLTNKDSLPTSTKNALNGKSNILIVGGTGSVSSNIENNLNGTVKRIGGSDRYEVSANILKDQSLGLNPDKVYLSSGQTFADALTGSVLAAKEGSPLLLTSGTTLPDVTKKTLVSAKTSIVTILGGTGSVNQNVEKSLPNEYFITPGSSYTAKVVNGDLVLYKGSSVVKNFGNESFTLTTSYSTSNRLNIRTGTDRTYLGTIEFTNENNKVKPINKSIPFEDYLKGVVPREMPASWNEEALKAQAVAARTFAARYPQGTIIDDSQSYQVYGGYAIDQYTDKINRVVDLTKGQVLRSNGQLITAFFTSSNGGQTLTNTNTYGTDLVPYLAKKADPYDLAVSSSANQFKEWNYKINKTQINLDGLDLTKPSEWWSKVQEKDSTITTRIKSWLSSSAYINPRYEIKLTEISDVNFTTSFSANDTIMGEIQMKYLLMDKSTGDYVMEDGKVKQGSVTISRRAYDIRSIIGSDLMRGPYVKKVEYSYGAFTVTGGGWGHGMGMSQYGANEMAENPNIKYTDILKFYYPGASLGN
jgi:SpoIID/LytB domain protein